MKWNKILDEKLSKLINSGKTNLEISFLLKTSIGSIKNRCRRLGFKRIHKINIICLNCEKNFIFNKSGKRKFCSNSCSNSHSSRNRKHTKETKEKIRLKLIGVKKSEETRNKLLGKGNPNWKGGKSILKNDKFKILFSGTEKEKRIRICRFCKEFKIENKYKIICDDCKITYYKYYRPLCEFDFNLNNHPNKFNLSLIKKHGRYSPSNKNNNLNGVSRDHMYSVYSGFINKVDSEIIKHPANCRLLLHADNNKKKTRNTITLEQLLEKIKSWDSKA